MTGNCPLGRGERGVYLRENGPTFPPVFLKILIYFLPLALINFPHSPEIEYPRVILLAISQ
jgi:hypothetical protein